MNSLGGIILLWLRISTFYHSLVGDTANDEWTACEKYIIFTVLCLTLLNTWRGLGGSFLAVLDSFIRRNSSAVMDVRYFTAGILFTTLKIVKRKNGEEEQFSGTVFTFPSHKRRIFLNKTIQSLGNRCVEDYSTYS